LYFKSKKRKGLIIYFHGNADNVAQWGELSSDFTNKGFDLLMVDYPTFGKSTGRLGQKQLVRMGFDVYDFCEQFYSENKLVLYGRSIGSGLASTVAAQRNPGLVILETPYVDIKTLVDYHAPRYTPTSLILSLSLSNKKCIPLIKCPVLLFHGTDDDIIPYEQAMELSKVLSKKDKLITIEGANHRNLNQYNVYHDELQKALDTVG
jgi:alpha-beta hydrolase superfamily lysophospholipase